MFVQSVLLSSIGFVREMSGGHATFQIKPSRWSWNKFKDLLHFYTMVAVIPATIAITCINVFIGPAKLAEIPEGYIPQAHEYHQVCLQLKNTFVNIDLIVKLHITASYHSLDGQACHKKLSARV